MFVLSNSSTLRTSCALAIGEQFTLNSLSDEFSLNYQTRLEFPQQHKNKRNQKQAPRTIAITSSIQAPDVGVVRPSERIDLWWATDFTNATKPVLLSARPSTRSAVSWLFSPTAFAIATVPSVVIVLSPMYSSRNGVLADKRRANDTHDASSSDVPVFRVNNHQKNPATKKNHEILCASLLSMCNVDKLAWYSKLFSNTEKSLTFNPTTIFVWC